MARFARRLVINSTMRAGSRPEKFPDRMVVFVSRVAISTTMPVTFWKKLKARQTARFCTRSFTPMTQRAGKLVIPCSTPPANWSAAQAAAPLLVHPHRQNHSQERKDDRSGVAVALEPVVGEGDAVVPCVLSGNFNLLKSEPLIANVLSRPSTRAQNVPSLF